MTTMPERDKHYGRDQLNAGSRRIQYPFPCIPFNIEKDNWDNEQRKPTSNGPFRSNLAIGHPVGIHFPAVKIPRKILN